MGGKVPVRGSIGVSVLEGLLRSIAADAAGDTNNALYDKTLTRRASGAVLGSSLIRLSGACPMLLSVDLQMLFSLFSAACNWAASPP